MQRPLFGMSGRKVALPMEEADVQITLICTSRTVAATRQASRQIGGYARALSHVGSHAM